MYLFDSEALLALFILHLFAVFLLAFLSFLDTGCLGAFQITSERPRESFGHNLTLLSVNFCISRSKVSYQRQLFCELCNSFQEERRGVICGSHNASSKPATLRYQGWDGF